MDLNKLLKRCGNIDDSFHDIHIYVGDSHFWYDPDCKSWMNVFKYTRGSNLASLLSPIFKSEKITDKQFKNILNNIIKPNFEIRKIKK